MESSWNSAESLVENTTKDDIKNGKTLKKIERKLKDLFDDHELYMSDKAELISAWLNAALQLDKKYGTNLLEQLRNDHVIFQETLAYGSHTFMTPKQVGGIFDSGRESMDVEKRQEVIDDPMNKMILVHRLGGENNSNNQIKLSIRTNQIAASNEAFLADQAVNGKNATRTKGLSNLSVAFLKLKDLESKATEAFGDVFIVLKRQVLNKKERNAKGKNAWYAGTSDTRSLTMRIGAIKSGNDWYYWHKRKRWYEKLKGLGGFSTLTVFIPSCLISLNGHSP
ncbi:hypothetical protein [uncultured Veillonella sp.]|uniref:hypothetical protein n=1 Tax=uncultured Veillonella sp. TaxID=159268 RepID=UPI00261E0554|nr:hypothetical protein [uncultured Veillonella sp.]